MDEKAKFGGGVTRRVGRHPGLAYRAEHVVVSFGSGSQTPVRVVVMPAKSCASIDEVDDAC
jgi:hypothetical protein